MADKKGEKPIVWMGTALKNLCEFPVEMKKQAGYELFHVQNGLEATNWKPFPGVGPGTTEIILRDVDGWYRVLYVAKFEEAVYVLHSFQKKTNATSQKDVELAKDRYKDVILERKPKK